MDYILIMNIRYCTSCLVQLGKVVSTYDRVEEELHTKRYFTSRFGMLTLKKAVMFP